RRDATQSDFQSPGARGHDHRLHRAGGAGRPAARLGRLPDDLRRRPDADAVYACLQYRGPRVAQIIQGKLLKNLSEIRALIARHKRWDRVFAVFGLLALMAGVLTFMALFVDMA